MELIQDTIHRYRKLYGTEPSHIITAPGRINLIGEHTDYNLGFVLPIAIDRSIIIVVGRRRDKMLHLHTVDLQATVSTSLNKLEYDSTAVWSNYPKGVASILQRNGYRLNGANFCIRGNIPIGAGLSSSAALEVASALAFNELNNLHIPPIELIKISQSAETDFVGVQCGIMDQFISIMGKNNNALFLDCQSLEYRYISFHEKFKLIVCDTGVKRELRNSAYNQRQIECIEAVNEFKKIYPFINSLRDVTIDHLKESENKLSSVSMKRAKHIITENMRVIESVKALEENNYSKFGKLMFESHESLRDDYEVSNKELNVCVDVLHEIDGVYGARMTGAGFGGSVICLATDNAVNTIVERLRKDYQRNVGRTITIYMASSGDGAKVMKSQ